MLKADVPNPRVTSFMLTGRPARKVKQQLPLVVGTRSEHRAQHVIVVVATIIKDRLARVGNGRTRWRRAISHRKRSRGHREQRGLLFSSQPTSFQFVPSKFGSFFELSKLVFQTFHLRFEIRSIGGLAFLLFNLLFESMPLFIQLPNQCYGIIILRKQGLLFEKYVAIFAL